MWKSISKLRKEEKTNKEKLNLSQCRLGGKFHLIVTRKYKSPSNR